MTDQQAAALAVNYRQDDPDAWDVARAVAGDARAFADLVARLEARVYRFILRQVSADRAAEDLTQDTFLEVYRNLHRFQGASKFSTWVMGIALNLSRNYRTRAPERRYQFETEEALARHSDAGPSPHTQTELNETMATLQQGLAQLPDELREALVLVTMEGMSYEQAAEISGIPVGTAKNRVFRARRMLRDFLVAGGRDELIEP